MGGCGGTFLGISGIERRGRREIEQPKVGPKGESRPSGKVENRKLGKAEDRLTEGWPEGRSIGGDASQSLPQGSSEGGASRETLRIS